jgi:hypothetical protein
MRITIIPILIVVFLLGCAATLDVKQQRKVISSGLIGCPANEIVIIDDGNQTWLHGYSWIAECREKTGSHLKY